MWQEYLRLIRFDKPIGTLLLLWPTWWGLWLAYAGRPPFIIWLVFSCGVFLTRSAGCAINDYADYAFDGKVARTAARPLVTGAISRKGALLVCASLSLAAFALAAAFLKPLTLIWSLPALLLFVSYPYFKRFFALPQLYLGVAFSFGILMAFIESQGHVPVVAWLLFAANLLWVLAYDTIYALVDLADDLKIGIKTSAITFGRWVLFIIFCCYVGFYLLLLLVGHIERLNWPYYLAVTIAICLALKIYQQIRGRERNSCFAAFLFNNYLGCVIFIGLAVSYWL